MNTCSMTQDTTLMSVKRPTMQLWGEQFACKDLVNMFDISLNPYS